MIYRNSLTYAIEKLGVQTKRRTKFMELVFTQDILIKTANQYNIPVDNSLDGFTSKSYEGYEGYEGYDKEVSQSLELDKCDSDMDKNKTNSADDSTITNEGLKDLDEHYREKNENKREESSYGSTQRSYPSYEESKREHNRNTIYRINATDTWRCNICNLDGDKWYMQVHPCKGLTKISK